MRRSYKSLRHFQEGWSSLQTRSPTSTNTHPGRRLQTPTLGNLQVRITSKMCSKTFHTTSNCGSWASDQPSDLARLTLTTNYGATPPMCSTGSPATTACRYPGAHSCQPI